MGNYKSIYFSVDTPTPNLICLDALANWGCASEKRSMNIVPTKWYDARATAAFLKTTEYTVKKHCRKGKLEGKQVGFKKQWHVKGSSISQLRKELNMDLEGD